MFEIEKIFGKLCLIYVGSQSDSPLARQVCEGADRVCFDD